MMHSAYPRSVVRGKSKMQEQQALKNRLKTRLRKVPGFRVARFIYSLVRSVESRNSALLLLRPPKGLYQPYGTTSQDRYPGIFQQVLERVGDGADLRILSFGCATGEEVFSLRHYFQKATLVGLDINPLNIAVCRFRLWRIGDAKLRFAVAGSTIGEASPSYTSFSQWRSSDTAILTVHRLRRDATTTSASPTSRNP